MFYTKYQKKKGPTLCEWGLEYAVCIPCKGDRPSPKKDDMQIILNWWKSSSSKNLESVKNIIIAITPRSTLALCGNTNTGKTSIDRSNEYL